MMISIALIITAAASSNSEASQGTVKRSEELSQASVTTDLFEVSPIDRKLAAMAPWKHGRIRYQEHINNDENSIGAVLEGIRVGFWLQSSEGGVQLFETHGGVRHGLAYWVYEDARFEIGRFEKGKRHGRWSIVDFSGTYEVGAYENGLRQGEWLVYRQSNDTVENVTYHDGDVTNGAGADGQSEYHFASVHAEDGSVLIGLADRENDLQAVSVMLNPNGTISIVEMVDGKPNGAFARFEANGTVNVAPTVSKHGTVGMSTRIRPGHFVARFTHDKNRLHGMSEFAYSGGGYEQVPYVDGVRHGFGYAIDGDTHSFGEYVDGTKAEPWNSIIQDTPLGLQD